MQLSGGGHGAVEVGSALILEQNWEVEQVRPGCWWWWLYSVSLVTWREADRKAGAGPDWF